MGPFARHAGGMVNGVGPDGTCRGLDVSPIRTPPAGARQAERLAELGTLTGGLAHEIKNPLSTVQLNLQLLREDLEPSDAAYERLIRRLGTVQKETARLRDILDEFLRYAGKIEVDPKPCEVNHLLQELIDFFNPQAQLQRVQLRLRRSPEPLIVPLDERLVKQALLNLLINALQAMPEAGGDIILSAESASRWRSLMSSTRARDSA